MIKNIKLKRADFVVTKTGSRFDDFLSRLGIPADQREDYDAIEFPLDMKGLVFTATVYEPESPAERAARIADEQIAKEDAAK